MLLESSERQLILRWQQQLRGQLGWYSNIFGEKLFSFLERMWTFQVSLLSWLRRQQAWQQRMTSWQLERWLIRPRCPFWRQKLKNYQGEMLTGDLFHIQLSIDYQICFITFVFYLNLWCPGKKLSQNWQRSVNPRRGKWSKSRGLKQREENMRY